MKLVAPALAVLLAIVGCAGISVLTAHLIFRGADALVDGIRALPEPEEYVEPEEPPEAEIVETGEPVFQRLLQQMPYEAKRFSSTRYYDETMETTRSSQENAVPSRSDVPLPSSTSYDDDWGGWHGMNGRPYWFPDATFPHHLAP